MRDPMLGTIVPTADGTQVLPLHLHPEATVEVLPKQGDFSNVSCIYRMTYSELKAMDRAVFRHIFRYRHILILDCPLSGDWLWNEEWLHELVALDVTVPVQRQSMSILGFSLH